MMFVNNLNTYILPQLVSGIIGESGNEWANFWFLNFIIFSNNCFGSELILQLLYLFGNIKKS